jgi:hypothetical protein
LIFGVLRKETRAIETTERLLLSAGYITLGVAFIAWGMGRDKFPPAWGFSITLGILASGILFSLCKTGRDVAAQPAAARQAGKSSISASRQPSARISPDRRIP